MAGMVSFTAMSQAAINATIDRNVHRSVDEGGKGYELSLNETDFELFVSALQCAYEEGTPGLSEWAGQFLSDVAGTLGVEFV